MIFEKKHQMTIPEKLTATRRDEEVVSRFGISLDTPIRNISVRSSFSEINTIGEFAKKFHLSRSEYIRCKVLG